MLAVSESLSLRRKTESLVLFFETMTRILCPLICHFDVWKTMRKDLNDKINKSFKRL